MNPKLLSCCLCRCALILLVAKQGLNPAAMQIRLRGGWLLAGMLHCCSTLALPVGAWPFRM